MQHVVPKVSSRIAAAEGLNGFLAVTFLLSTLGDQESIPIRSDWHSSVSRLGNPWTAAGKKLLREYVQGFQREDYCLKVCRNQSKNLL
jgi:hypothetical protein